MRDNTAMSEMTIPSKKIVPVSYTEIAEKYEKKLNSLSKNKSYNPAIIVSGRKVLERSEKLIGRKSTVTLEIPRNFLNKLGTGEVIRHKGVLRSKNGQIIKHLPEVKPSKLSKAIKTANLALVGIQILESALLDEKLKEILTVVKEIDMKLEAQHRGAYKAALDQMIELTKYTNSKVRDRRIPTVHNGLAKSERLYKELYEAKWSHFRVQKQKYEKKLKISNQSELDNMRELANELFEHLSIILSCKISRVIIFFQMEKEIMQAQEKSLALLDYALNQFKRFENEFGSKELRRLKDKYQNPYTAVFTPKYDFEDSSRKFKELISGTEFIIDNLFLVDLTIPQYKIQEQPKRLEPNTSSTFSE